MPGELGAASFDFEFVLAAVVETSPIARSLCRSGSSPSDWFTGVDSDANVETEGHLSEGPPRWDSRRTVTLPLPVLDELRRHIDTYSERGRTGRVFVGAKGGTMQRSKFQATWREATKAADVPTLRFHDLRHVCNTLASNTGANLRELMARMGHASPQAALIYQRATAERERAIADAPGAMVNEALSDDDGEA